MSRKQITEGIRLAYLEKVSEFFKSEDEDVLRVKSNEIAMPVVGSDGSEEFVVVTIKVPNGSKDEPYDGYAMAEDYEIRLKEKEEKKKEQTTTTNKNDKTPQTPSQGNQNEQPTTTPTPENQNVEVTDISLNKNSLGLIIGNSDTLTANITPSNATNKSVTWSSSNSSIISVDNSGKVTAKAIGSATITAKTANGKEASATVTSDVKNITLTVGNQTISKY